MTAPCPEVLGSDDKVSYGENQLNRNSCRSWFEHVGLKGARSDPCERLIRRQFLFHVNFGIDLKSLNLSRVCVRHFKLEEATGIIYFRVLYCLVR